MIPPGADIALLSSQLSADGVAYSNGELANDEALNSAVAGSLAPGEGIAVVDVYPEKVADLRDLAQELQDATGLDTVIVQAPLNVSAVSDTHSRAALESAQSSIAPGTDQVALLEQFHAGIAQGQFPVGAVLAAVLILAAVAAVAAFRVARGRPESWAGDEQRAGCRAATVIRREKV